MDRRRNCGPANAQGLRFDTADENEIKEPAAKKPLDEQLFIKSGISKTCNGSSYIECDGTIVSASVYGPRPNFNKGFNPQATLRVTLELKNFLSLDSLKIRKESQKSEMTNDQLTSTIQSFVTTNCLDLILMDKYPKSAIDIFIDLLSLNSSHSMTFLLYVIQNAVNLALIDSGLNLRSMPSCGYLNESNNEIIVNCCHGFKYDSNEEDEGEEIIGTYSDLSDYDIDIEKLLTKCITKSKELRFEFNKFFLSQ